MLSGWTLVFFCFPLYETVTQGAKGARRGSIASPAGDRRRHDANEQCKHQWRIRFWPKSDLTKAANGHLMLSWPNADGDFFALICSGSSSNTRLRRVGHSVYSPHELILPDLVGSGFKLKPRLGQLERILLALGGPRPAMSFCGGSPAPTSDLAWERPFFGFSPSIPPILACAV